MSRIADRVRLIWQIQELGKGSFSANEGIAFQLRKIIEGLAYACVIASETGSKSKIRSARGHWNARTIFNQLDKKGCLGLPNPSELRSAEADEAMDEVKSVIQGKPEKCLSKSQIIEIYERTHDWLHEINPFYAERLDDLAKREDSLWNDVNSVVGMLERHFIAVAGEAFYCTLFDKTTGSTKVLPLARPPEYAQTH